MEKRGNMVGGQGARQRAESRTGYRGQDRDRDMMWDRVRTVNKGTEDRTRDKSQDRGQRAGQWTQCRAEDRGQDRDRGMIWDRRQGSRQRAGQRET